jgi:cell division GTPase FtsZ
MVLRPIGILGIGQAGGNIAEVAANKGFPTAVINTNEQDTTYQESVERRYLVAGLKGAGQNRQVGIQVVTEQWQQMVNFVKQSFQDVSMLFVAFSSDGGTGSGVSPILIDILTDTLGIPVGAIVVLPEKNVLAGNKINAAQCMSELSAIDSIASVLVVDNEQVRLTNPQATKKQLYGVSNHQVIRALDKLLSATEMESGFGNFDHRDLMNILQTRGATIISTAVLNDARTQDDATVVINNSWVNSIFAPIETPEIVRAGLIYEGPERSTRLINLPSIFKKVGEPLQLFEGTYISDSDATVTTVLSGLSFPVKRLGVMEESLERDKERFQTIVQRAHTQRYNPNLDWASDLKTPSMIRETGDVANKLSKYKK